MDVDVVVVGAGIAGISSAYFLQEAGYKVIVLEEKTIASGATGQSTGILWYGSGLNLLPSIDNFGEENARTLWKESDEAIRGMKKLIAKNDIGCELRSPGAIICARNDEEDAFLRNEADAMKKFGFAAKLLDMSEVKGYYPAANFTSGLMEDCSQIRPLKFVMSLSRLASINVWENSPMTGFEERDETVLVKTPAQEIKCSKLIVATNLKPLYGLEKFFTMESTVALYSQVLGEKIKEIFPVEKIFWTLDELYDMIYPQDGRAVLELYRYKDVDRKLQNYFPGLKFKIGNRRHGVWAKPKDWLPFIGKVGENVFSAIAMGDQGIVMGFACGKNASDMIEGKENSFLSMTSPSRVLK